MITSVSALTYLLKSDKLKMYSENTTFTVVHWWLKHREGWTDEERQGAFNTILESDVFRFHHMDSTYLTVYAMRSPWIKGSGQAFEIMHRAMLRSKGAKVRKGSKLPSSRATKKARRPVLMGVNGLSWRPF